MSKLAASIVRERLPLSKNFKEGGDRRETLILFSLVLYQWSH
jgi:hypothetical protein